MRKLYVPGLLCLGILGGFNASASTIVDNGGPDLQNAYNIHQDRAADDFVLASAATVASIRMWAVSLGGNFGSDFTGDLTWAIYNNSAGSLGTLVSSGSVSGVSFTPIGQNAFGSNPVELIEFGISPVALSAGHYWLELHQGLTLTASGGNSIFWMSSALKNFASKQDPIPDLPTTANGTDVAFQLFDTGAAASVPEPGTWALLAMGIAGIAAGRARRRA